MTINWSRRVRHNARHTTYRAAPAAFQVSTRDENGVEARVITDGDEVVVYQAEHDGKLYVRFPDEVADPNRFTRLKLEDAPTDIDEREVEEQARKIWDIPGPWSDGERLHCLLKAAASIVKTRTALADSTLSAVETEKEAICHALRGIVRVWEDTPLLKENLDNAITYGRKVLDETVGAIVAEKLRFEDLEAIDDLVDDGDFELPEMTERGLAGQLMDIAWPLAGGNHQPAEFWWAVAFAMKIAVKVSEKTRDDTLVPIHKDGNYVFIDGPGDVELDHGGRMRKALERAESALAASGDEDALAAVRDALRIGG